ncbi:TPA: cell division/cell wall cluster transcriptional repressor MraZ [Patescibacteria group bacterium]|uniref:Transcriptional regulator MraZ n=1 Tax=candidate division Kazan bacterium GW2011_GWA1_44_22 TaxID=1620410 RepID=A0A0G1I1M0_UNCK3|nr:MAG: Protein MraZ [candidate division Kazan bacterium GW2011_GWA1_44_22]HAR54778.1 cell division/cell wall cluster transcriptional repressor MraZ [Patescibacteria group bacterium]HCR42045.1 cell division/cell wall cluster transcriptional repressor MraZ [Patescibacteria group bacterium]
MFIGEYAHTIDEKSRLAIPVKFRKELSKGAIVTKGLDGCLFLYTLTEWQKLVDRMNQMPISQKNARAFSRLILAGAMDVEIDKQGRIVLPKYLVDYAKVKRNVIVAGLFNRLEIWDTHTWDSYKQKTEKDSETLAEQLFI